MLRRIWIGAALAIGLLFSPTLHAQDGVKYKVDFSGSDDGKLVAMLKSLSDAVSQQETLPGNTFQLRRRAERDVDTMTRGLHAEGYYAAEVRFELDTELDPALLRFDISTGEQYLIGDVAIVISDKPDSFVALFPLQKVNLPETGNSARAQEVVDAEAGLLRVLREQGYRFANAPDRAVTVDHATKTMDVRYGINAGPLAHFGPINISGLDTVQERVVFAEIPWNEGDEYRESLVERLRKRLYETGLFSVIRIQLSELTSEAQQLPILIELTERDKRTFWSGVDYYSDEGLGVGIGWEHRNIRGLGHRLMFEGRFGQTRIETKAEYRLRNFGREGQTLRLGIEGGEYEPEAYSRTFIRTSAIVDRKLTDRLTGSIGLAFKVSEIEQLDETESFTLLSLPTELLWDRSNHLLDPTKGFKLSGHVEPFVDPIDAGVMFLKSGVSVNYYLPLIDEGKLTLAMRAMVGNIVGEALDQIPADERYYAGGGGSIRGYTFQTVGPLEGDEPTGGGSKIEGSAELRYRFTEHFGVVGFVDGGSAFESSTPDFSEDLLFGAGVGLRYYSPIGPLRLDVALPLDRRDDIDESFQLYLSIGQSF